MISRLQGICSCLLQSDIDSLASWTEQNFLQFNADKFKYMVISRKHQAILSLVSQSPLQINSVTMEKVASSLGVQIGLYIIMLSAKSVMLPSNRVG